MNKKTVKRSISLRGDVFETAMSEADRFFGGNFSAYLTYLICADKHGISRGYGDNETIDKERVMDSVTGYEKNSENEDYINEILGM